MGNVYEAMLPGAMEVARRISGQVKVRGRGLLHIVGTHQNLAVRVRASMGSREVDYGVDVRMPEARKPLRIRRVAEPESMYAEFRRGWDHWDIEDGGDDDEQRVYVADHVCHAGSAVDVEASQAVWESLPDEVRGLVIELLDGGGGFVSWRDDRLTLDPADDAALRELVVASMKLLDFGVWLGHSLKKLEAGYR